MKKRYMATATLALLLASCVNHKNSHPHGMPPGQAKKVVHAHGHNCGHFFVNGTWNATPASPGHNKSKKKH